MQLNKRIVLTLNQNELNIIKASLNYLHHRLNKHFVTGAHDMLKKEVITKKGLEKLREGLK